MAIGTNATIDFWGTQDTITVAGGTSAVTNTSFSASGDVVSGGWTNDDDATHAAFVLKFQYPSGTIVADGIHLYARLMNIDSTNDEAQPDASHAGHYLGTFVPDTGLAATTDSYVALEASPTRLHNQYTSQVYEFYIENQCNVTLSAAWTIKITPVSIGPHA